MNKKYNIALAALCCVIFAVLTVAVFIWDFFDNDDLLPPSLPLTALFILLFFPTLPVTAIAELICLKTENSDTLEKIAFLLDIAGTVLVSGMWLFMVLQGGNVIIPYTLVISGINIDVCILFGIKIKYGNLLPSH